MVRDSVRLGGLVKVLSSSAAGTEVQLSIPSRISVAEQTNATTVTANPDAALSRFPAFQELPKMLRYGMKPVTTIRDTRLLHQFHNKPDSSGEHQHRDERREPRRS